MGIYKEEHELVSPILVSAFSSCNPNRCPKHGYGEVVLRFPLVEAESSFDSSWSGHPTLSALRLSSSEVARKVWY
jgi:hypothetical protein